AIKLAPVAMELAVEADAHLTPLLRRHEPRRIFVAVDREHMKTVRAAVAAVGGGVAAVVDGPAPPRAAHGGHHVMMVRRGARVAVGGAEIVMLGRMGVAGDAHARPVADQLEKLAA